MMGKKSTRTSKEYLGWQEVNWDAPEFVPWVEWLGLQNVRLKHEYYRCLLE